MADRISALARLHAFGSTWKDDAEIDEECGLTAADLDTILAAAEGLDEDAAGNLLIGGDYDLGKLA